MLIKSQITLPFIVTLCFAKCIIGTQSGWYFPPFASDKLPRKSRGHGYHNQHQQQQPDSSTTTKTTTTGQDKETIFSNESQQSSSDNSILGHMERIKSYADYQSSQLAQATSRANDMEYRLASAVDLTRRKRMHFFYGLMLQSYNYIRDLRIKGQNMVKDVRKQVKRLTRLARKASYKMYKLNSSMETMEKLIGESSNLEDKINRSVDEFDDILNDFMGEVYKSARQRNEENGS